MTRKPYPSDLAELQWSNIADLFPAPKPGGRPRTYADRDIADAIFYLLRTGCAWRQLPHDFPPWDTVYGYFRRWQRDGTWRRVHDALRNDLRLAAGRDPQPTAAVLDSQSVKTTERGGLRGYDAGKKINGRKRHLLVDCLGLLLAVAVHPADIQDRDGAVFVLGPARLKYPELALVWADGGYRGALVAWVRDFCGWVLRTVLRPIGVRGFVLLPRRWVVERTFAWLGQYRRLSKDYEFLTDVSETMIVVAMIHLMARHAVW